MKNTFSWPVLSRKQESKPEPLSIPNDEAEIRESIEREDFKRGMISFDVAIGKNGVPYILEIQDKNAGVYGIEELEDNEARPHLKKLAKLWNEDKHARYKNPRWFGVVSRDKRLQSKFIPSENSPHTVVDANFDHLFDYGRVILKPHNGMQGKDIEIFDRETASKAREYAEKLAKKGGYVAQSFIETKGADLAPKDLEGHQTSLRLLVPFKLNDANEPEIMLSRFGYQRVARYGLSEIGTKIRGLRVEIEDAGVVNFSRDAAAVAMSDEEYELVKPLALEVIKRLVAYAPHATEEREQVIQQDLEKQFLLVFANFRRSYPYVSLDIYQRFGIHRDDRDPGVALRFLRMVENEFSSIDKKILESSAMKAGNLNIMRVRDESESAYALIHFKSDKNVDVYDEAPLEQSGALKGSIENMVRKNRALFS